MPPVKFLAFKRHAYIVAIILLLSEIIPTYSYYMLKGLVYIIIIAPSGCQPFFYTKCIKLNMRSSCNIKSVFIAKCVYFIHSCVLQSLQLPYLICLRVSCNSCCRET